MKKSIVFVIVLLLLAIPSYTKERQDYDQLRWTINVEGATYLLNKDSGWGWGGGLKTMYDLTPTFGIHVGAIYLPTSGRGYSFRGIALDGGIRYRLKRQIAFEAGFSYLTGDDHDGSLFKSIGVHAGANVVSWLGKHFGISGRAVSRFWFKNEDFDSSSMYPISLSLSAGLALRF